MKRWRYMISLIIFAIALFSLGVWLESQKQVERDQALIPTRSELVVYTDVDPEMMGYIARAYEETHHVRITVQPISTQQMKTRILLSETDQQGDLVITSDRVLRQSGEQGSTLPIEGFAYDTTPNRFKGSDHTWLGLWYDPFIFAEREGFFAGDGKYVSTWYSLGRVGQWSVVMTDFVAVPEAADLLYTLGANYGDDAAIDYFKALGTHVSQYAKFMSTPMRLASLGETDVGVGTYSAGKQYESHKYPVKLIFPTDGSPYVLTAVGILSSTKDKAESLRFVSWLHSAALGEVLANHGIYYMYVNPAIEQPRDALGHTIQLLDNKGQYTDEEKQALLQTWIGQVRFRKG